MTTPAPSPRRVLLVDDHPIYRDGLAALINRQEDLFVCGEAGDARSAACAIEEHAPDIVILDLMLDGGGGIDLIKELHGRFPELRILVLSMFDEETYAERAVRA